MPTPSLYRVTKVEAGFYEMRHRNGAYIGYVMRNRGEWSLRYEDRDGHIHRSVHRTKQLALRALKMEAEPDLLRGRLRTDYGKGDAS